jgi:hypothetical protein
MGRWGRCMRSSWPVRPLRSSWQGGSRWRGTGGFWWRAGGQDASGTSSPGAEEGRSCRCAPAGAERTSHHGPGSGFVLVHRSGLPGRAGPGLAASWRVQPRDVGIADDHLVSVVAGQNPIASRGPAQAVRGPGQSGTRRGRRASGRRPRRDRRGRHCHGPGGHRRDTRTLRDPVRQQVPPGQDRHPRGVRDPASAGHRRLVRTE